MPDAITILAGLETLAQRYLWLAVLCHALAFAAIVALMIGRRPSNRLAATLLGLPLTCVALLAALAANPFNAAIFLMLAIVAVIVAMRARGAAESPSKPVLVTGIAALAYAWLHPHFLDGYTRAIYLVGAPMGSFRAQP